MPITLTPAPQPPNLSRGVEKLFGPLLIGVWFNAILYGMLVVQAYSYFQLPHRDNRWTQVLVIVLLIAETINTGLDFGTIWQPLITDFGQPSDSTPISLASDPVVTSFISTIVQLYLGWRIRIFTKSKLVAGVVFLLAFLSFAAGTTSTIFVGLLPNFGDIHKFQWALIMWLSFSAACDVVISVSLVCFLVKYRKDSLDVTVSVVNKIILMTIQTGCITSVAAIADILTFILVKGSTVQFIWDFSLSKLYTNCLLSTLNARAEWNRVLEARHSAEEVSDISFVHIEGVTDYSQKDSKKTDFNSIKSLRCAPPNQLQSYISQSHSIHSIAISPLPPLNHTDSIYTASDNDSYHHHPRNRPLVTIKPPARKSSLSPS